MAPLDILEPHCLPIAVCSKSRARSFALGRQRSTSRSSTTRHSNPHFEADEPRGRPLTRELVLHLLDNNLDAPAGYAEMNILTVDLAEPDVDRHLTVDLAGPDVNRHDDSLVNGTWDECAMDFVGGLLAEAVDDYSDEAAHLAEVFGNEAYLVEDVGEPSIPEESQDFMELLLAEEEVMLAEEQVRDALRADVDSEDTKSHCSDYPDSELLEAMYDVAARPAAHTDNSSFSDYVRIMFEAALSGGALEFFGSENSPTGWDLDNQVPEEAAGTLPTLASLMPCSRPAFRRRLRPCAIPPPAEEFPMDCLPSTPVCLSAPEGPSLEMWAEQLQREAFAEELCNLTLINSNDVEEAPLDGSFIQEETVMVAVAPQQPKGGTGFRPRPCHQLLRESQQARLVVPPQRPSTPRTHRPGAGCKGPFVMPPDIGSTEAITRTTHEHPLATPPACLPMSSVAAPTPPNAPAPSGRASRPRPHLVAYAELADTAAVIAGKRASAVQPASPSPPSDSPAYPNPATLRQTLDLGSNGSHLVQSSKTAMEMDLGLAGVTAPTDTKPLTTVPMGSVRKDRAGSSFTKSPGVLPAIFLPTRAFIQTHCGTWKAHDVSY